MYVDNTETVTLLEWCAGYGGIGLGLKRVFGERLRTIAYCELEGYAQANLISKMEKGFMDVAPIWTDVKTFPTQEFHGLVDIFSAGYPCQPFSTAGKRLGEEDPRHLWPFIQRAIATIQPRFCFFENVRGHLTLGFKNVCHDLGELGYEIVAGLFTAAECGAPHKRERLYIMAHSKRCGLERGWLRRMDEVMLQQGIHTSTTPTVQICGDIWGKGPGSVVGLSNGSASRVEQLRMGGNGVVPQTAELAFQTLYKELMA